MSCWTTFLRDKCCAIAFKSAHSLQCAHSSPSLVFFGDKIMYTFYLNFIFGVEIMNVFSSSFSLLIAEWCQVHFTHQFRFPLYFHSRDLKHLSNSIISVLPPFSLKRSETLITLLEVVREKANNLLASLDKAGKVQSRGLTSLWDYIQHILKLHLIWQQCFQDVIYIQVGFVLLHSNFIYSLYWSLFNSVST